MGFCSSFSIFILVLLQVGQKLYLWSNLLFVSLRVLCSRKADSLLLGNEIQHLPRNQLEWFLFPRLFSSQLVVKAWCSGLLDLFSCWRLLSALALKRAVLSGLGVHHDAVFPPHLPAINIRRQDGSFILSPALWEIPPFLNFSTILLFFFFLAVFAWKMFGHHFILLTA